MKKKKFKLFDAILAAVCIILVAEAVTPTASIGNSQYFWYLFIIFLFCLPYGLITAELGSTYPSEGGMYTWVKKAFGPKWASRVAWNYWINFPLWMSSLAVAVTDIIMGVFNIELSIMWLILIQLGYIWVVTYLGSNRIGENKILINLGTLFKVLFMVGLGVLGIYVYSVTGESANPINSVSDLLPTMDLVNLSFISVIIFNFLGLEVVATFAKDMDNPKRDIPKAIIIAIVLIAIFYLLPATGINIAMPAADAASAGITESFAILLTTLGVSSNIIRIIVIGVGIMFIYTLVANIASWSFGVNSVAKFSADDDGLPKIFAKTNKKGVPYMSAIMNGVVASGVLIIGLILSLLSDNITNLFWTFFSLSVVTHQISHIPMFFAFLKLRKTDKTKREYKVPGNKFFIYLISIIPFVVILLCLTFTLFIDFTFESIISNLPLIFGIIISFIIQEIIVSDIKEKRKDIVKK